MTIRFSLRRICNRFPTLIVTIDTAATTVHAVANSFISAH